MSWRIGDYDPLRVDYDAFSDILTIDGIKYAGELFRAFAFAEIGTKVEIIARDNGTVTLRTIE